MNTKNDKETKKSKQVAPSTSLSDLISFDEFDSFFDDFLTHRRWPRLSDWSFPTTLDQGFPKIDIIDHENDIEVQAALPGIKKEELEVSINNQSITIRTTSKKEEKQEGKYFRREITKGEFQRTLSLPDNIDSDSAKAKFENGMLTLTIPKTEKSQRKCIKIN